MASTPDSDVLLVTCEHASRAVPGWLRARFHGASAELASHRGFDRGARGVARALARRYRAPLHEGRASRLVVDLNRSRGHPTLFSEHTRTLPEADRTRLLDEIYDPYRGAVERRVRAAARRERGTTHVSVHSFTPVLDGRRRELDVGLLFDPGRARERALAERWRAALAELAPDVRTFFNRPYRGTSDGLTRALRATFPERVYAGLELELNQALWELPPGARARVLDAVATSLGRARAAGAARRRR